MTRRFKTEPVSARMMIKLTERAAMPHGDYSKQERAVRILLHWWAQGHNPARNVATCRECGGDGREAVFGDKCPACKRARPLLVSPCPPCNGTGKAVKL